jgi:hypothetical protein
MNDREQELRREFQRRVSAADDTLKTAIEAAQTKRDETLKAADYAMAAAFESAERHRHETAAAHLKQRETLYQLDEWLKTELATIGEPTNG